MQLNRRSGLIALIVSSGLAALLLVLFLRSDGPARPGVVTPPGESSGAPAQEASGRESAAITVRKSAQDAGETSPDTEELEDEQGTPLLTGFVYGESSPLPGATVTAYPFAFAKKLINKYESLSIGGLGDIPGLVRQVKSDLFTLRAQGAGSPEIVRRAL